jgi:cyclic pyranopterin phosphate synthase
VDRLNISLDTLRPERFRYITRLGSLAQTLEGIRAAEEAVFFSSLLHSLLQKPLTQ